MAAERVVCAAESMAAERAAERVVCAAGSMAAERVVACAGYALTMEWGQPLLSIILCLFLLERAYMR